RVTSTTASHSGRRSAASRWRTASTPRANSPPSARRMARNGRVSASRRHKRTKARSQPAAPASPRWAKRGPGSSPRIPGSSPAAGANVGRAHGQNTRQRKREVADEDRGRGDPRQEQTKVVVTGPGGAAWTTDEGENCNPRPDVAGYWAVAFANEHDGWLVGTGGRILKITF